MMPPPPPMPSHTGVVGGVDDGIIKGEPKMMNQSPLAAQNSQGYLSATLKHLEPSIFL